MAVPFSMRRTPKAVGDFVFNNDIAIVPIKMPLVDSITNGLTRIHNDMAAMKGSIDPIIFCHLTKFMNFFPTFVRDAGAEDNCDKMTLGFSNVPGPKSTWILTGKRCQGIGFIMPVVKSLTGSFSCLSHADTVKMIITFDKAVMDSPSVIAEYMMKNLDEILGDPEWRNYGK